MTQWVSISIETPPDTLAGDEWLIVPRPIADWHSRCVALEFDAVEKVHETAALNSAQRAFLLKPAPGKVPAIRFGFSKNTLEPDQSIWHLQDNRYTKASTELCALASELTQNQHTEHEKVKALIENAALHFGYEHPPLRFNDGHDDVPVLCGTTKGSCVDINTYLIAAARSLGIKVQYMAGYWFHPDKKATRDMHCWLVFECEGVPVFWDLAHHLKWGVDELAPGLNPAGGRRVPMSCGRGLQFETAQGQVLISHFSEPLWIKPGGELIKPAMWISLIEE